MTRRALLVAEPRSGALSAGQLGVLSALARVAETVEVLLPVGAEGDAAGLTGVLGRYGAGVVRVVTGLPATAAPRVAVVAALHREQPYDLVAFEN
ncbi:hypothetical protein, partial [Nocardioides sp.]|uniref:hypothetical protein n=1 Tax=Nocardioides sp. TaxID=35761 RepID=UPI0025D1A4C2